MKALIVSTQEAQGLRITLLGTGPTEAEARRAAFQICNGGFNPYDSEYTGGQVLDMSPSLSAIIHYADESAATYDEAGQLLGLAATDAALLYPWAVSTLYVSQGVLYSRVKLGDQPWLR
jgi:hypothetical protein